MPLRSLHSFSFVVSSLSLVSAVTAAAELRVSAFTAYLMPDVDAARVSHDPTANADRLDRFMGVETRAFFLSHGGFVEGFTKYGESFHRPALNQPPQAIIVNGKSVFE